MRAAALCQRRASPGHPEGAEGACRVMRSGHRSFLLCPGRPVREALLLFVLGPYFGAERGEWGIACRSSFQPITSTCSSRSGPSPPGRLQPRWLPTQVSPRRPPPPTHACSFVLVAPAGTCGVAGVSLRGKDHDMMVAGGQDLRANLANSVTLYPAFSSENICLLESGEGREREIPSRVGSARTPSEGDKDPSA